MREYTTTMGWKPFRILLEFFGGYNLSMPKLTPKIILEGTRLTFKTDIAFALNDHPRIVGPRKYKYHSPLISAEWCTFTNFPWGRGPINFEPQEESLAMETYATGRAWSSCNAITRGSWTVFIYPHELIN